MISGAGIAFIPFPESTTNPLLPVRMRCDRARTLCLLLCASGNVRAQMRNVTRNLCAQSGRQGATLLLPPVKAERVKE